MRIEDSPSRLVVRDNPVGFWAFYSIFVVSGLGALYLGWAQTPDRLSSVIVTFIGFSHLAGGLCMIWREPASVVELDRARGLVDVRRWGLFRREAQTLVRGLIDRAEVEVGEHSEGGAIYRPCLVLRSGERVPVSCFWYQTEDKSAKVAGCLNAGLAG